MKNDITTSSENSEGQATPSGRTGDKSNEISKGTKPKKSQDFVKIAAEQA